MQTNQYAEATSMMYRSAPARSPASAKVDLNNLDQPPNSIITPSSTTASSATGNDSSNSIGTLSPNSLAAASNLVLNDILARLIESSKMKGTGNHQYSHSQRDALTSIHTLSNSLAADSAPSVKEFHSFVKSVHDVFAMGDPVLRPLIMRVLRLCMLTPSHCELLVLEELHWLVIISLERDTENIQERLQALKLVKRFIAVSPSTVPLAFARSLVAVAGSVEDNIRRVCVETLRELSVVNTAIVATVGGISILFDIILEPSMQDMSESILLTMLHLLNCPQTRQHLRPYLDLRSLIAPFTDFDQENNDTQLARWRAAKSAIVLVMRSWVGIIQFTSDSLGLPTLVKMLRDPKISPALQDILLSTFIEIFEPVTSTAKIQHSNNSVMSSGYSRYTSHIENHVSEMFADKPSKGSSSQPLSGFVANAASDKSMNYTRGPDMFSPPLTSSSSSSSTISSSSVTAAGPNSQKTTASGGFMGFLSRAANPFSPPFAKKKNAPNAPAFNARPTSAPVRYNESPSMTPLSTGVVSSSSYASTSSSSMSLGSASSSSSSISSTSSTATTSTSPSSDAPPATVGSSINLLDPDPLHNLMDNYAGILCCAFVHAGVIDSLCSLGTYSEINVAMKSRTLLITIIRVMARVFPWSKCAEMLTVHSLMEFAAPSISKNMTNKAHNASQMLSALAANLSVKPYEIRPRVAISEFEDDLASSERFSSFGGLATTYQSFPTSPIPMGGSTKQIITSSSKVVGGMGNGVGGGAGGMGGGGGQLLAGGNTGAQVNVPSGRGNWNANNNLVVSIASTVNTVKELADDLRASSASKSIAHTSVFSNGNINAGNMNGQLSGNRGNVFGGAFRGYGGGLGNSNATKSSNLSNASNLANNIGDATSFETDIYQEIRRALSTGVDKAEFARQLEDSKVLVIKEPFPKNGQGWDWKTIADMLENSFQDPDRLQEALKTKWFRRISGFYRCCNDDKAYFANLDWEPNNLHYLECAFHQYRILVNDEKGIAFLESDRRGILFNEITREVEQLVTNYVKARNANTTTAASNNNGTIKNVFRLTCCNQNMSREFFSLVGWMMCYVGGQQLLNNTNLLQHMSTAGSIRSLEYFCRLIITSLAFTDGGFWSRHLMQTWTTSSSSSSSSPSRECSIDLVFYIQNLLRALSVSRPLDFYKWGIDILVSHLSQDESNPALTGSHENALKVLEEAAEYKPNLIAIIAKRPKLSSIIGDSPLLTRFCSVPSGIDYLLRTNWLNTKLTSFRGTGFRDYAQSLEKAMAMALSNNHMRKMLSQAVQPITIPVLSINGDSGGGSNNRININLGNDGLDLEGILRIPWNVEIKLTAQAGYTQSGPLYLKTDTFVDTSSLPSAVDSTMTQDGSRIIKIRSVILDSRGLPTGQPIATNLIINNCLLMGTCGVNRNGRILVPNHNEKGARRRTSASASTIMMQGAGMAGGRENNNTTRNSEAGGDYDIPATYQNESNHDWSYCKPGHRQGNVVELVDNKFAVEIAGEPCVWIFSRTPPISSQANAANSNNRDSGAGGFASQMLRRRTGSFSAGHIQSHHIPTAASAAGPSTQQSNKSSTSDIGNSLFGAGNRSDASRAGTSVYLLEVQYYLRLETGLPLYIPITRHLWGELAKSPEGCAIIDDLHCIQEMLALARDRGPNTKSIDCRGALWALGHIGSSDLGFAAICAQDPDFVSWCIDLACCSPDYHMRGTAFQVIGLLSRSGKAQRQLRQLRWDYSPPGSRAAFAMPRNFRDLFAHHSHNHERLSSAASYKLAPPPEVCGATPLLNPGEVSPELELINYLLRFPGMLLYKESRAKIELLRSSHPEMLSSRAVFVVVMKLLEKYTFKLAARREIVKMFSAHAKTKAPPPQTRERGLGSKGGGGANSSANGSASASFATAGSITITPTMSEN